jgi:hypothetical protein
MKRDTGIEPVTYRWIVFAVSIPKLEESRGVEPHPILHENLVFKTSRRTIPTALLSIDWCSMTESNCRNLITKQV